MSTEKQKRYEPMNQVDIRTLLREIERVPEHFDDNVIRSTFAAALLYIMGKLT